MKNKGIITHIIKDRFLEDWRKRKSLLKFAKRVSELGIHKITIIFKINVFKLCKKYRKLLKSSIGLRFFKDYHKDIKAICEENEKCF